MKKIFVFGLLSILVLGVAGCGKKGTVTCTLDSINGIAVSTATPKHEIIIDYEGNKVTDIKGNYVYESADIAKEQYDLIYQYAVENSSKMNFSVEGNKIVNITSKNDVVQIATGNINETKKDKIVDGLKNAGYTCK